MRVLVLGGSWFVGRAVVAEAVGRGHEVTVFNRGVSQAMVPDGVRQVIGDREVLADLRTLARRGPWDVVIDAAGSVPAVVQRGATVLADVAGRCVFVSTISAYRDWPHAPVDETSPLWPGDPDADPGTRRWDPDAYGPLKVGCEMACLAAFGERRLLTLRPQVVLGPYEYVGRLPWWLSRMRRGGQVLAPAPDRAVQPIDVRDLARFLVRCVEQGTVGVLNVAPQPWVTTFGGMLVACVAAVAQDAERPVELIWVDENWLVKQGVTQWTELPLWRNAAAPWAMNTERACDAGLRCRPLSETVADTWTWLQAGGQVVAHERFAEHGVAPAREKMLIRRWLAARPH